MRFLSTILTALLCLVSSTSCSVNILESFADKNTNGVYIHNAKSHVNNGNYDLALTELAKVTGTAATSEEVILLRASAYGGKCGLNFVDLVAALQNMGTTNFFVVLMQAMRAGTVTKAGFCLQAENLVESLGATAAARTTDQNAFLAVLSFAKLGTWLSYQADGNNDLAVDDIDYCDSGTFSDADVREVGSAINIGLYSLAASGVSVSTGALDPSVVCPALGAQDFCSTEIVNPASFTADQIKGIRSMVRSGPATSAVGIFSCNQAADINTCVVPLCP